MTFRHAFLAGVAAIGLSLSGISSVYAQENEAGTVDIEVDQSARADEDNWLKVCDQIEDGREACIMRQVVLENGVFTGSFLLRNDPGQESRLLAVAAVPLGVLLPFGLTWQIDGGKPVRVPYMVCDPRSCAAQLVVNEAYVQSLKRGATLKLTAKNRQNEDVTVEVDLSGFTATYESEDAMTIEELNQSNSTESALDQVLQDRAAQMRDGQDGEGGNTEAAPEGGEDGSAAPQGEDGAAAQ